MLGLRRPFECFKIGAGFLLVRRDKIGKNIIAENIQVLGASPCFCRLPEPCGPPIAAIEGSSPVMEQTKRDFLTRHYRAALGTYDT